MTITRRDFQDGIIRSGSGFNTNYSTGVSVNVGDTIVAIFRWAHGSDAITAIPITCTGESNLTLIGGHVGPGPNGTYSQWAILKSATASGTKTIGCTPTGTADNGYCVCGWVLSGVHSDGNDGTGSNASGTGTTPSVGVTTSLSNGAILALMQTDIGSDLSLPGTGYTEETTLQNLYGPEAAEYNLNVGAAGAKTVNATIPSGAWIIHALAIKSADGTGGSTQAPRSIHMINQMRA